MIVNPGIRRFLGSAIQRLFNSASFSAPLTHSLVPERGTGSPTYTRASTATFRDWEGVLRTVPSGCARFEGARYVRNLLTFTEDLTNAAWIVDGGVTKTNATTVTFTAVADRDLQQIITTDSTVVGRKFVFSVTLALQSGTPSLDSDIKLRAEGTSISGEQTQNIGLSISSTPTRFSFVITTTAAGTTVITGIQSDIACAITFTEAQLEDVTGQADQTASEYVSVGVLSDPWHGAGVDGVEFFNTDRDGAVIPAATNTGYLAEGARTNLCLQSNAFTTTWTANGTPAATQNVIGPDGGTTGWTLTDNNAASIEAFSQTIALTAATYTYSVFVNKTTGAQSSYPVIATDNVVSRIAACTVDTTNGVATVWTAYTGLTVQTSSATCVSHNENYWRVSLTFLATAENWTHYLIVAATTNATQSTGYFDSTAQGSAVFYGAQVELGSFATPYIPTTTVAVARNADVNQYPTIDGPIAAAGSIALDFTPYHAPSGTIALWGTYVDASNYTAILHDATNLIFRKRIAGSNYDATIANAFVSGTTYKVAATWGAAGTAIYLDGVAGTPHANTTAAQIAATMQVGADGNSLQQPGAGTTNLRIWQRQLSSPEGVAVTA